MKKAIIAAMVALALAGCASSSLSLSSSKAKNDHAIFETVYSAHLGNLRVIRDKETGREYICYSGGYGVAITPRLPKEEKK